MPVFEIDVRGKVYEIDAPDVEAASRAATRLAQQPQHMEFDASGIPGFNPETGMVDREQMEASLPRTTATIMGAVEGLPIVGPYARQGVEATSATIGSQLTGLPYEQVRSEMAGMTDEAAADHPYFHTAGKVGGAVAGTLPMVMAAPGLFGASAGPLGAGLAGRTAMSTASGAGLGGTDAATRSDGDWGSILNGMLYGGAAGVISPAIGEVAGAGARWAGSRFGDSSAQKAFTRAAGADAIDDVGARLAQLGDESMPMDLGPGLRSQAGAIANRPGPGQQIVRSAVAKRQASAGDRVSSALDDALGQRVDTVALADDIISTASRRADPLYKAAYSKPVPFTSELETLLKRPTVGRALREAQRLAADDETFDAATRSWFANVADDGTVNISRTPSVYELDMTKRALDDLYTAAKQGGSKNEARIIDQLRKNLLRHVDEHVPEYTSARKIYAGPASVVEAMEEGQKAFSNSLTPNQMRTQLMKMGEAEKEAFIQGARAQVADIMGTARNDALAARSAFQKGYNREKLELLIGKDQARRLLAALDAETAFAETNREITQQSITAGRQQANKALDATTEPGLIREFDVTRPGATLARIGDKIAGGSRADVQQGVNEELARLLTSRDPRSLTRTIKIVQAAQRRGDISAQRAKEIIQSLGVGGQLQTNKPLEITVGAGVR